MRSIQDFFSKILCILLIVVLNSNVLLFAEDSLKLDGSYLVGCSFLEKTFFGMSNFREREYEFTDNRLIVTNFKKKTYTQYSYIIKGDFIHLKKEKGTDDYFDDTVMEFEISSKSLLSKRELILWPSAGKPLKFVEEESLRKRASNVALGTAAVAGTVAVGAAVSSGVGAGAAATSGAAKFTSAAKYTSDGKNINPDKSKKVLEDKSKKVLETVKKTGKAPEGYEGGKIFKNKEGLLPEFDKNGKPITYKEFDVNPKIDGQNRGVERLVIGSDGSAWMTDDHYKSFIPLE